MIKTIVVLHTQLEMAAEELIHSFHMFYNGLLDSFKELDNNMGEYNRFINEEETT